MLTIIEKNAPFELSVMSKQATPSKFYFGAGWDTRDGAAVDLDIVAVLKRDGKLTKGEDFIYFGNKVANGVMLSEDNQTGEGDGDDEDIVMDLDSVDADVDSIVVGLVAYSGADLSDAPNTHFRVCDGQTEDSPQIGEVNFGDVAVKGDTAIVAFELVRTATGWVLENKSELLQLGQGSSAIQAFGARFQA